MPVPLMPEDVIRMYEEAGAILTGHFTLTSGLHSDGYIQSSHILGRPEHVEVLAAELASRFEGEGITCVVGPTIGGIVLAYAVARHLGARAVYAERLQGVLGFARGYRLGDGDRVLVVDDVIITGRSLQETIELSQLTGATIVGASVIIDRSDEPHDFGVPTERLAKWQVDVYPAEKCPLCARNVPLRRPKYGRL